MRLLSEDLIIQGDFCLTPYLVYRWWLELLAGHSRQEAKQSCNIRQSSVAGVRSSMRASVMKGGRMAAPKGFSEIPLGMAHRVGHQTLHCMQHRMHFSIPVDTLCIGQTCEMQCRSMMRKELTGRPSSWCRGRWWPRSPRCRQLCLPCCRAGRTQAAAFWAASTESPA